ncbi:NADH-quinone oxidoreductase subunit C [Chloroflexota bacterium]
MTIPFPIGEAAKQITERLPGISMEVGDTSIIVKSESLSEVATLLKTTASLDFDYLTSINAVDYLDYLELVYQLVSIEHNHSLVLKTRCYDRENPIVPSVVSLWQGADFQEREAHDLMGIRFEGHPNLKPIVLWDGFQGHPLRKDYL